MAKLATACTEYWQSFTHGDEGAFRAIYELTYDALYGYGYRLLPDAGAVRDDMQEVYLALWQRRESNREVENCWFFLLTSLRNRIIDRSRRAKISSSSPDKEDSFEEELIKTETEALRRAWLNRQLDRLPPRQREALHLRYRTELDYPEIARLMKVSVQVAYNYVNRAIKTLREEIKGAPEWFFEK